MPFLPFARLEQASHFGRRARGHFTRLRNARASAKVAVPPGILNPRRRIAWT